MRNRVELSENEREYARAILLGNGIAKTFKKRAQILLLRDTSFGKALTEAETAQRVGVSDVTVYKTAKDFNTKGIEETLRFKKRDKPTNPPIVTGEREARIIALACGSPPEGFSRWTIKLLTAKIVELDIMPTVSRETVRTALKKRYLNLT